MPIVNMLEAKTNLSRLVDAVESGAEAEIVIARNGRPAARLVAIRKLDKGPRIGVAKGAFECPIDRCRQRRRGSVDYRPGRQIDGSGGGI
jgi:prevent-host-death family protein